MATSAAYDGSPWGSVSLELYIYIYTLKVSIIEIAYNRVKRERTPPRGGLPDFGVF